MTLPVPHAKIEDEANSERKWGIEVAASLGKSKSITRPGSKVWDYTYDASGRQDSIHHKDGATVKQGFDYTFDDGGNITRIDHEDGSYWEYDYDGRERLIEAIRGNHATPTILATYGYAYDDGDNMLTKQVPWYDDFEDGNITGWSGHTTYYSVTGGVLKNTSDTTVRDLYLSETDADHDLSFDYVRYSSTGRVDVYLRTIDGNNRLYLEINPGDIKLRQVDGGTLSTLATYTTTVTEDAWYKLRAILDGTSVKIYWGAQGADFNEIISATTTKTTTVRAAYFRAQANSEHGIDNIQLIAGTRSTTETFTYNNANEQITHAKNGVTTTMTYDDWGRLATRDDGTHETTYTYRYGSKLYSVASDFPGEGNVTYETGGDGKRRNRIAGVNETWYNYTIGFDVVSTESDADGSTGALTTTNVVSSPHAQVSATLADVAGTTPSSGTASYFATDHLGSTQSVWNASKMAVGTYEYDPYGSAYNHTGVAMASLAGTFTGKPWDEEAQLFHFPYREYSPGMARWIMRDPLGMVDGPNMYGYISASPINATDKLGLCGETCESQEIDCLLDCASTYTRKQDKIWKELTECMGFAIGVCLTTCTTVCVFSGPGFPGCMLACMPGCLGGEGLLCRWFFKRKMKRAEKKFQDCNLGCAEEAKKCKGGK